MIGLTLGRYRLLQEIGAGGMGVVYRAHDDRLDRDVAVKVLASALLADPSARKRLRKEAIALSKLNHPGIATVHDFGSQRGIDFLVMELIPGVSLKDKLADGPLPEADVLRLGTEMAAALATAHEKGIVHRDLKPANLRITPEGRLKILDFGLARLRPPGSEVDMTTGTVAGGEIVTGTLPYMAPEHLRGQDVDMRSDVHAAGAVLYEMATGSRAFPQSGAQLIDSILNRRPTAPRHVHAFVSVALEGIILKALEKSPDRRYQSARELLAALERLKESTEPASVDVPPRALRRRHRWFVTGGLSAATAAMVAGLLSLPGTRPEGASSGRIQSLAVLPLENLSRDPDQEYFADGMTEAVIAELARVGSLRVISRTSAMQYKGTRKRLPEIAKELGVDAILEGSVLRSGPRVRITAQLLQGSTDRHLWGDTYERDLIDVLALQAEVARAVTRQVQAKLTSREQDRLAGTKSIDPQLYELYLKGRAHLHQGREAEVRQAVRHFEQAVAKDAAYAPAWSGLADAYLRLDDYDAMPDAEAREKAKAAANKALEIDEGLAEAHGSLGHLALHEWDWAGGDKRFRRAIELEPGYASAHQFYSAYLAAIGRPEQALTHARQARSLDPLSADTGVTLVWQLYLSRRFDEAIELGRQIVGTPPVPTRAHWRLGCAYLAKGATREAAAELERFAELTPARVRGLSVRAILHARRGDRAQANALLQQIAAQPTADYDPAIELAVVHASLGHSDQAFRWLDKAYRDRLEWLAWLKVDPLFDPLRKDPRFTELVRKVGLP